MWKAYRQLPSKSSMPKHWKNVARWKRIMVKAQCLRAHPAHNKLMELNKMVRCYKELKGYKGTVGQLITKSAQMFQIARRDAVLEEISCLVEKSQK